MLGGEDFFNFILIARLQLDGQWSSGLPPGKYRGMVNLQERYMKNVMDAIVGRKVEPIGHKIDTLGDAEGAQFCVI